MLAVSIGFSVYKYNQASTGKNFPAVSSHFHSNSRAYKMSVCNLCWGSSSLIFLYHLEQKINNE